MKRQRATAVEIERSLYGRIGKSNYDGETQLMKSVLEYLRLVIGIPAFRRNVGTREYLDEQGKVRLVQFNEAGMSDIWAIVSGSGVHVEIELKIGHGARAQPTETQRAWLDGVRAAGGIALAVTSLDQLARELEAEFAKRGWRWKAGWRL
jgi:hypothetical protein